LKNNIKTVCLLPLTKDVKYFNELVKQALKISTLEILADDAKYNKRIKKKSNNLKTTNDTAGLEKV
jgi:hypothetical protein